MIIIFSEKNDYSTNNVIDWLIHFKAKFVRYNGELTEKSILNFEENKFLIDLNKEDCSITSNDFKFYSSNINSIWYRRPYKGITDIFDNESIILTDIEIEKRVKNNLKFHNLTFKECLIYFFNKSKIKIGSYEVTSLNKLQVLKLAKKNQLLIPQTIVTNSKEEVLKFLKINKKIITKPLYEVLKFYESEKVYLSLTKLITSENDINFFFSPSLFQSYIEKEYEIRVFYLNFKCYSMAIFSQNNEKTIVDFRNYDNERMNRMVPYNLPLDEEKKIQKLMISLDLNCGSIDLIKSTDSNFYFLEVNPVGQFDFLSKCCNYNLEKKIAEQLISI